MLEGKRLSALDSHSQMDHQVKFQKPGLEKDLYEEQEDEDYDSLAGNNNPMHNYQIQKMSTGKIEDGKEQSTTKQNDLKLPEIGATPGAVTDSRDFEKQAASVENSVSSRGIGDDEEERRTLLLSNRSDLFKDSIRTYK